MKVESTDNIAIKTLAEEVRDQLASGLEYTDRCDLDDEHTHTDTSKAAELLGYESKDTIREGVGKFVNWYKENRE